MRVTVFEENKDELRVIIYYQEKVIVDVILPKEKKEE